MSTEPWQGHVLLRDWPGEIPGSHPRLSPGEVTRLWQRHALVLYAAARRGAMPEALGLGAALVVSGRSVLCRSLLVPDDFGESDPDALAALLRWASGQPVARSEAPWRVVTVSAFFDPLATVEAAPWTFQPNAYSGAGFVLGADLGRTLGLCAEHWVARRGRGRGSWELWLPGWGRPHRDGSVKRRSPHRPPLYVRARRVGWQVTFGPCAPGSGKIHRGHPWRGAFWDLMSGAYAFDADRGASFAEHCEDFGLPPTELPLSVEPDGEGASEMADAVGALHRLALVLDDEAGRWFTTPRDRRECRGRVDVVRLASPGALAAQIPARFGLRPPLETLRLGDEEHRRWAEAFHGGWCEADRRLLGVPFPVVSADVSSCYPLVAHHLGWWDLMCAEGIHRRSVAGALRRLCARVVMDPAIVLEPGVWRCFGATRVRVVPDGEDFPIGLDDPRRPDGRMEVTRVSSPYRPMLFAWPDVVLAAVRSRRVPRIGSAVRYAPVGRQEIRRHLPLLPGLVLHSEDDPVLALVRYRRRVKPKDYRLAAELRVVANSLVYGNLCRFDDLWRKEGRRWVLGERPGPWNFLPIASSVAAGARLLLAVLERLVTDLGGLVAYRDTDSALIPSTPQGREIGLLDGRSLRALSWAQVDEVLTAFAPLQPGPGWPVWTMKREKEGHGLSAVVFGQKRHASYIGASSVDTSPKRSGSRSTR